MAGQRSPGAWRGFLASFAFAWNGLVEGALRGRNLRIHLAAGVAASGLAALAPLARAERALLLGCVALVVALESANTAVEMAVDLARPRPDEAARRAKDAAAGAVLAAAAGSVLVLAALVGTRAGALAGALEARPWGAGGAALAAAAAGLLPWRAGRSAARDGLLALAGLAGLAALARSAASHAGTSGAALCLAVALGAAVRSRTHPWNHAG
jgi:diacylglycerol kinase (ATP)